MLYFVIMNCVVKDPTVLVIELSEHFCRWEKYSRQTWVSSVSNLGFGFAGGESPLHLKSRGDFSNGGGIFFSSQIRYENHKISISCQFSWKLQPCPFPLPFWHEFRIHGGCRLLSHCWRHCFRAVNCDNGRRTHLSSCCCRSGLEKKQL